MRPDPAMVTVTPTDGTEVPSMVSDVGATVQAAPFGSEQVKFSTCLKPLRGVAKTLKVAVPPAAGAVIVCVELLSVKSEAPEDPGARPVPVNATVCGEFVATPPTLRFTA